MSFSFFCIICCLGRLKNEDNDYSPLSLFFFFLAWFLAYAAMLSRHNHHRVSVG